MGFFSSLVGAVAGPLIGGIFQNKRDKDAQKDYEKNKGVDYQKMVKDAQAAGFNPLTALMAGGSSSYTYNPPKLSSGSFIQEAIDRGVDTWFNQDQVAMDKEVQGLKRDMLKEELDQLRNKDKVPANFGYSIPAMTSTNASDVQPKMASERLRPQARPTIDTISRIPVMRPDGQMSMVPKDAAERLGIKPFGYAMAGDYTELVGEARGEAENLLVADKVGQAVGIPLSGGKTERQKKADAEWRKENMPRFVPDTNPRMLEWFN